MIINRRKFLKNSALGTLTLAIPSMTLSQIDLGSATISTISDGTITLPGSLSFDTSMPSSELEVILKDFDLSKDELTRECNLTLYESGTKKVLFDAGAGAGIPLTENIQAQTKAQAQAQTQTQPPGAVT